MMIEYVQAQYEVLEQVARRFAHCVESTGTLQADIQEHYEKLRDGWEGEGALAFRSDMESTLFPALQRLRHALEVGQQGVLNIKRIMEEAETTAAALFRGQATAMSLGFGFMPTTTMVGFAGALPVAGIFGSAFANLVPPKDAYVISDADLKKYKGKANGNGHCPGIAQSHFLKQPIGIGLTTEWKPGVKLSDHPVLQKGTVIATFDQAGATGQYPGKSHGNHVAIFLDYVRDKDNNITGVKVLDQWSGSVASEREIPFVSEAVAKKRRGKPSKHDGGLLVNEANDMYVVTNPTRNPVTP